MKLTIVIVLTRKCLFTMEGNVCHACLQTGGTWLQDHACMVSQICGVRQLSSQLLVDNPELFDLDLFKQTSLQ